VPSLSSRDRRGRPVLQGLRNIVGGGSPGPVQIHPAHRKSRRVPSKLFPAFFRCLCGVHRRSFRYCRRRPSDPRLPGRPIGAQAEAGAIGRGEGSSPHAVHAAGIVAHFMSNGLLMPAPVGHDDFIIRPPVFRKRQEMPFEGIFRGFAAFAPNDYSGGTRRGGWRISLRIRIVQGNLLSFTGQPSQHPRLQISVRQTVACRRTDPVDRQHERPVRGRWTRWSPTDAFRFSSPLRLTGTSVRTRGGFIPPASPPDGQVLGHLERTSA